MSGREKFEKYSKLIKIFTKILSILSKKRLKKMYEKLKFGESNFKLVVRYCILSNLVLEMGNNVFIGEFVTIKNPEKISIGNNVSIHKNCYLDGLGNIVIKDDVSIATDTKIFSFNHTYKDVSIPIKYNELEYGEVYINNDVWIGTNAIILPGVNIGKRTIIGAGAIVTKSIDDNSIAVGNPARIIKKI